MFHMTYNITYQIYALYIFLTSTAHWSMFLNCSVVKASCFAFGGGYGNSCWSSSLCGAICRLVYASFAARNNCGVGNSVNALQTAARRVLSSTSESEFICVMIASDGSNVCLLRARDAACYKLLIIKNL